MAITDKDGNIINRRSYTPFGEIRHLLYKEAVQKGQNLSTIDALKFSTTNRSFTGHESIEGSDLIHMNGRVYDPTVGRFLSADPYLQAPYNSQSYNRYTYVMNNPLNLVDPSGYFWGIGSWFKRKGKSLVNHVKDNAWEYFKWGGIGGNPFVQNTVARNKTVQVVGSLIAASIVGPLGSAGWAAYVTDAAGGSTSDIIKNGAIAGASSWVAAEVSNGIGDGFGHNLSYFTAKSGSQYAMATLKSIAHGLSQAGIQKIRTGTGKGAFLSGFIASGFSVGNSGYGGVMGRTAIMVIVGGTVSEIGGGKFANGAMTAAFVHLYNAEMGGFGAWKKSSIGAGKGGTVKFKVGGKYREIYIDKNGNIVPSKSILYDPAKSSWKETVGPNNFTQAERALQTNLEGTSRATSTHSRRGGGLADLVGDILSGIFGK